MIKSKKIINRDGTITFEIYDGNKVIFSNTIFRDVPSCKLDIIDAYTGNVYLQHSEYSHDKFKKNVLKALGKVDDDFKTLYHEEYPWGGKRENSGRKKGSFNTDKRVDRTERLRHKLTIKEKKFLLEALLYYRKEIAPNIKLKQEIDTRIQEREKT